MPSLREIFAEYLIRFDPRRDIERGNRQVTQLRSTLQRLRPTVASATTALAGMATAAGVGAAAGLQRIVSSTVESTREIERWSGRLSISSGALRSWIELGREYGASVDDVTDALKELQLKAQDAISGGTAQAEMFERIGISIAELRPVVNDADALMALFTTRLNRVNDVALRNFTVDELMSDAGTRLNQVFALGTEEIARRRAALTRSMGPMEGLTRAVSEHVRNVIQMSRRWERFKREVTARVLPILGEISRKLLEFEEPARRVIRSIMDIIRNTHLLRGALIGVGVVAAIAATATIGAWGPVAAAMIGVVAAVAAVAAAYDQVSRTIEGSNTSLRKFLDNSALLGEGGTTGIILALGDAWDRIPGILDEASNGARLLVNDFNMLMTQLGAVSEVLQAIWTVVSAIMERTIAGRLLTAVRGVAQGRAEQERSKERRRLQTQDPSAPEDIDYMTGQVVDASGQPMSLDLSQIDVVPIDAPAPEPAPEPEQPVIPYRYRVPQPMAVASNIDVLPMSPAERDITIPRIPRSRQIEEAAVPRAERPPPQNIAIDAPMTMTLSVAEATDAQEVGQIVTDRVRTEMRGQVAQLESLVSDQTEVGS